MALLAGACGGGGGDDEASSLLRQVISVGQPPDSNFVVDLDGPVEGFPPDFPAYANARVIASFLSELETGADYRLILSTPDSVEKVIEFYNDELDKAGDWQITSVTRTWEAGSIQWIDAGDDEFRGTLVASISEKAEKEKAEKEKEVGPTTIGITLSYAPRLNQDLGPYQLRESLPVPDGFPQGVNMYPGATIIGSAWIRADAASVSYFLRMLTTDFEEQVIDFYRSDLSPNRWTIVEGAAPGPSAYSLAFVDSRSESLGGLISADVFSEDTQYTEVILQVDAAVSVSP